MEALKLPIEGYDFNKSYIKEIKIESNQVMISFYSLIAMTVLMAVHNRIRTTSDVNNQGGYTGIRVSPSSINRWVLIIAKTIGNVTLGMALNPIVVIFINYGLRVNKFSPVAIISDGLFKVNIMKDHSGLGFGLVVLIVATGLMLIVSYLYLRRAKYDSI